MTGRVRRLRPIAGFPDIRDAVGAAEPIDSPAAYRFQANIRRRYERMRQFPQGFLVMGDAICSFNPIYGQGMTVAALQALALRDHLTPNIAPHSRRVLRALARMIDGPWEMTIGADLAVRGVDGRRTPRRRIAGAYVTRLQAAAAHDPALARAFMRVTGLVDRPEAIVPAAGWRTLFDRLVVRRAVERTVCETMANLERRFRERVVARAALGDTSVSGRATQQRSSASRAHWRHGACW